MRIGNVVLTGAGDRALDREVQRQAEAGKLVRLADRIYVDADATDVEKAVYDAAPRILSVVAPGAVLFGASGSRVVPIRQAGPDGRPVFPGWLYATHVNGTARKSVSLPGLEIRSSPGKGNLRGDQSYLGIHIPSEARRALENLQPSRSREGPARTLGRTGVEEMLARILEKDGADRLVRLRDEARALAPELGCTRELALLEEIVEGLTHARDIRFESDRVGTRYRRSDPYELDCVERLRSLVAELRRSDLPDVEDPHVGRDVRECVSFAEAYFSNYIEGTRFLVEKARRIVFDDEIPAARAKDAQDVVQTFRQVAAFVRQTSAMGIDDGSRDGFAGFLDELRERHATLMAARPEVRPGLLKEDFNRAGNHVFVAPNLVTGTLREGHAMLGDLEDPFARAIFAHTLSVLVHPFDDGNGRVSRILMTKELVGAGRCRIVVPTIFRDDYIGAMRAVSRPEGCTAAPLIRSMTFLQSVTAVIAAPDLDRTIEGWASTFAFLEDQKEARLEVPSGEAIEWRKGVPAPRSYYAALDAAVDEARPSAFRF